MDQREITGPQTEIMLSVLAGTSNAHALWRIWWHSFL